jgi:hypothetical protein
MFHITHVNGNTLPDPIILSVTKEVKAEENSRDGETGFMHGMMGWGLVGGVVMVVMMVTMFIAGSR